ncbi:hypothetical protein IE81DRAFT_248803 [Ceraceosorus guamensis]|uniref:Uncharacterized protein n=1 Tax=Ceraceosorus guamensis TaxID=1522189 RepID=A0A316VWV4_9BASI|nr:hypothetical protein IE81DRAFT_248803 [Ceraceosorus guamensis]PWN39945.1 hypothetical protein IE81DRAFT_248803 [Ceraceosorus guamensis]
MNYHTPSGSPVPNGEMSRADIARAALRSLGGQQQQQQQQQQPSWQQQQHVAMPHLPHPSNLPAAPAAAGGSYFGGTVVGSSPTSSPILAPAQSSGNMAAPSGVVRRVSQRQTGRTSARPPSSSSWCDTPGSQASHLSNQSHASYLSSTSAAPSLSLSLSTNNGSNGSLHASFSGEVPLCTPPHSAFFNNAPGHPAAPLLPVPQRSEAMFQRVADRLQLDVADVKSAVLQQDARNQAGSRDARPPATHHRLDRDTLRLILETVRAEDEQRLAKLASFRTEYLRAESLRMQVELEQHRQAHVRDLEHPAAGHTHGAVPGTPPPPYEISENQRTHAYPRQVPPALPSRAHRSMDDYTTGPPLLPPLQTSSQPQNSALNRPRHSVPFHAAATHHSERILAPLPHQAPPALMRRRDTSASLPHDVFGNPFASLPRSPDLFFPSPSTHADSIASESRRGSVDSNMSGVGSKRRHDESESIPTHEHGAEWLPRQGDGLAASVAARLAPPRTSSLADATARMDIRDTNPAGSSRRTNGSIRPRGKASRPSSSESNANSSTGSLDHEEVMARLRSKVAARLAAKQQHGSASTGLGLVDAMPLQSTPAHRRSSRGRTNRPESAGNAPRRRSVESRSASRPRKVASMSHLQRCDEAPSRSPSDEEQQQTPIATKQTGRPFDSPNVSGSTGIEALLNAAAIRETNAAATISSLADPSSAIAPISENAITPPSLRTAA